MTKTELYNTDFYTAVEKLSLEENTITCMEVLKDFIKIQIDEDGLYLAAHLLDAIRSYHSEYYDYDYTMGTLDTPFPLTELEDLEDYCDEETEVI